jgi:asparagine synthase (glutamine-hydrolysing)
MSAFVALVAPLGSALDAQLIRDLTGSLAPIGPDGSHFWVGKRAGLGHALLELPGSPPHEPQPGTLDHQTWIVADVRLDGRAELLAALKSAGRRVDSNTDDAELLLHSYDMWGESCVEHLIGDFAFALWDGRRDTLFCARDHFGVVPLYYAKVDGGLIVSNALDCVRLHPLVTHRLNEVAIGDYLQFGFNQERRATVFTDVLRLPPAHGMDWSVGGLRTFCYWKLPRGRRRNLDPDDVLDRFLHIYRRAIEDRLTPGPIAIPMSGGLDSTSIAALALDASRRGNGSAITAHVTGVSRLMRDDEPAQAASVARALGIPLTTYDGDAYLFDRTGPDAWFAPPEPRFTLAVAPEREIRESVTARGDRILLFGIGGDPALGRARGERFGWLPPGLRGSLRRLVGFTRSDLDQRFDDSWLNQDFARRIDLSHRWRESLRRTASMSRRRAMSDHPLWDSLLSSGHSEFTEMPLVARHPFFDVRLLTLLQAIPSEPWFRHKRILREAMRGVLPDSTLERPKTILAAEFHEALATQRQDPWREELARTPELAEYVAPGALIEAIRAPQTVTKRYVRRVIFPLGLAFWLRERAPRPRLARPVDQGITVKQLL